MKKNKHEGSDFRDFLAEEGILEKVEASALKRALVIQLNRAIKENAKAHQCALEHAAQHRRHRDRNERVDRRV